MGQDSDDDMENDDLKWSKILSASESGCAWIGRHNGGLAKVCQKSPISKDSLKMSHAVAEHIVTKHLAKRKRLCPSSCRVGVAQNKHPGGTAAIGCFFTVPLPSWILGSM